MRRISVESVSANVGSIPWDTVIRRAGIALTAALASVVPALIGMVTILFFIDSGSDWLQPDSHKLFGLISFFFVSWTCFITMFTFPRSWRIHALAVCGQLAVNSSLIAAYAQSTRTVSICQHLNGFAACATPALKTSFYPCAAYDLFVIGAMHFYLLVRSRMPRG